MIGAETLARSPTTIDCGTPTATTAGTSSVKIPVFIALEAVLIAATMVLRAAIEAAVCC